MRALRETESVVGPYELHDFFLFHFLRYGEPPEKILYLAEHARFDQHYTPDERRSWLAVFTRRFFAIRQNFFSCHAFARSSR